MADRPVRLTFPTCGEGGACILGGRFAATAGHSDNSLRAGRVPARSFGILSTLLDGSGRGRFVLGRGDRLPPPLAGVLADGRLAFAGRRDACVSRDLADLGRGERREVGHPCRRHSRLECGDDIGRRVFARLVMGRLSASVSAGRSLECFLVLIHTDDHTAIGLRSHGYDDSITHMRNTGTEREGKMEIWRAEPGDVVRLPASCWPRVVIVTDCDGAGPDFNRLSWEDEDAGARGSVVLPDTLEVDLLHTERDSKRVFLSPASLDA